MASDAPATVNRTKSGAHQKQCTVRDGTFAAFCTLQLTPARMSFFGFKTQASKVS